MPTSEKARALAAEVADTVTFVQAPDEPRAEVTRLARELRTVRDVELANAVAVIGDRVAPHMAPPDTDTAAARAADSLVTLPDDPAAAAEEIQRRRVFYHALKPGCPDERTYVDQDCANTRALSTPPSRHFNAMPETSFHDESRRPGTQHPLTPLVACA